MILVESEAFSDFQLFKGLCPMEFESDSTFIFHFDDCWPALRKPILALHDRFEAGGGWGLERTLNTWVCQQPWRQRLPLSFFEMLSW